jgi:3-hydroxyisobutyrate dehydrogenase-like beta-hydroxyacid dehydrogenase
VLGFVGFGVMGAPMCANLARKSGARVLAHDRFRALPARLKRLGVEPAPTLAALAPAEIVFLSLPGRADVEAVGRALAGILRPGAVVVDHSTAPVETARALARRLARRRVGFLDAPVARTRQAAEAGTLAMMVGGSAATLARAKPLLATMASDIAHCGGVGAGQAVKLLNNMVLFQTGLALAEALAIGRRAGVPARVLFSALAAGSADSFALRNHGAKAMLPGRFPKRAFSVVYALKDLAYARALARTAGISAAGAAAAAAALRAARKRGEGDLYWPVIARAVAARGRR